MTRVSILFIAIAMLASTACKKKEGGASSEAQPVETAAKPADQAKPAPLVPEAPAAKQPKVFEYPSGQAFNDDYRSVNGAAFMDKFGLDGRFRITGAVGTVITEQAGNSKIMLALDDNKKIVSLGFADDGKAVAAKGLKKGDAIKVLCKAGGADDHMIMLLDCVLE